MWIRMRPCGIGDRAEIADVTVAADPDGWAFRDADVVVSVQPLVERSRASPHVAVGRQRHLPGARAFQDGVAIADPRRDVRWTRHWGPFWGGGVTRHRRTEFALPARSARSVFDDLIDPVDHAGDVATELQEEGPQHLEARTVLDEDGKEGKKEAQDDEQNLDHLCAVRPHQVFSQWRNGRARD